MLQTNNTLQEHSHNSNLMNNEYWIYETNKQTNSQKL